ncbi:transposase domain-containing protein [Belnapia sp. T6]|uniref:Transposase domain-containing protein n=2 Tax=Belnapia mucosa TaxID=2804532 RepID=A0ABS1V234_9PROT|nr:transposase domain-containing protein [Belnapia mucosa]
MVYHAIAMALYMGLSTREVLRCLLEGLRWLWGAKAVRVAGMSGMSQAHSRLEEVPLQRLHEGLVQPMATRAKYRGWRLVSLDGTCLAPAWTWPRREQPAAAAPAGAAGRLLPDHGLPE